MSAFPAFPSTVKGGEPATVSDLQYMDTLPADNVAWFGGAIVVPDLTNGGMKLCAGAAVVDKGIGVAHFNGKIDTAINGTFFRAPAVVYSKYTQAAAIKVGQYAKTMANGLWEGSVDKANAFAKVVGKWTEGGGGATEPFTTIVQNEYAKLELIL